MNVIKIKLNLPITIDQKLAETLERTHSENPLLFTYKKHNTIGIHTCLKLHKTSSSEMFFKRLSEKQISIDTIDKNYVRGFPKERLLKLNVSNVKEDRIEEGIRKIIEIKQLEHISFQFKKKKMNK